MFQNVIDLISVLLQVDDMAERAPETYGGIMQEVVFMALCYTGLGVEPPKDLPAEVCLRCRNNRSAIMGTGPDADSWCLEGHQQFCGALSFQA